MADVSIGNSGRWGLDPHCLLTYSWACGTNDLTQHKQLEWRLTIDQTTTASMVVQAEPDECSPRSLNS